MKRIKIHKLLLFSFAALLLLALASAGAQGQGDGGITLTWSAYDPGDASLQVWYWIEIQLPDFSFVGRTVQATSVTFAGLVAGTGYPYLIDGYGCSASEAVAVVDGTRPACADFSAVDSGTATATAPATATPSPTATAPAPTATAPAGNGDSAGHSCTLAYSGPGGSGSISISWSPHPPDSLNPGSTIWYCAHSNYEAKITNKTSANFSGLIPGDEYGWHVDAYSCVGTESMEDDTCLLITGENPHAAGSAIASGGRQSASGSSGGGGGTGSGSSSGGGDSSDDDESDSAPSAPAPALLDHSVTVSGSAFFQPVTGAGIGNAAVIAQGVVSATDVWGHVPAGTRVCFIGRSGSGVMFLDAATSPRALSWLNHFVIGRDICVDLPGAGTVVLVGMASAPPAAVTPLPADDRPQPASPAPASLCLIKLTETLFLRALPEGEILGLVWLNSEVPVYAIEGDWYLVEFEGRYGYISRQSRQILSGSC